MSTISIIKKGITDFDTDCIVNAANDGLWEGGGVCGTIFKAAGSPELTKAYNAIGGCKTGNAVFTPGFKLKAKYIIHAVGPVYKDGKHNEAKLLYSSYKQSLILAKDNNCHSIAFPLISAGIFGYPKPEAWRKALQACNDFLNNNPDYAMDIYFAILDDSIIDLGKKVYQEVMGIEYNSSQTLQKTQKNNDDRFVFFWQIDQENGYLSQWYPSPFEVDGIQYETAEQFMMAKKALLFEDYTIYADIMNEKDPKKCKDLGKLVRHFDAEKWDSCKSEIIYNGNLAKFLQNYELREKLLATGDKVLAEASPYDKIWGIGLKASNLDATNPDKWNGQNLLGRALMEVRNTLALESIRWDLDEWYVHAGFDGPAYFLNDYQIEEYKKLLHIIFGEHLPDNLKNI